MLKDFYSRLSGVQKGLLFSATAIVLGTTVLASPSYAQVGQTTTNTSPATVLDSMDTGRGKMDDIAGAGAALGMSSTIFGSAALIFKRFTHS